DREDPEMSINLSPRDIRRVLKELVVKVAGSVDDIVSDEVEGMDNKKRECLLGILENNIASVVCNPPTDYGFRIALMRKVVRKQTEQDWERWERGIQERSRASDEPESNASSSGSVHQQETNSKHPSGTQK